MSTRVAARNNAELCDLVCRTHGITGEFAPDAWTSARRTPPLYPDAVTLAPGVVGSELLGRIDTGPGCSVKDSFADLDLHVAGFEILFSAEWIHRPADVAPTDGRLAPETGAGRPMVELVAGARLNRSADVVGVSNVVASSTTLDDLWPSLLATIVEMFPGLPIVGYESGAELDAALRHGFTSIGPLRVWSKPD